MNKIILFLKQAVAVLVVIALLLPSAALAAAGMFDDDGNIIEKVFEQEWRKYSDFPSPGEDIYADEDWPLQSRSWEVQQYYGIQEEIDTLRYESLLLETEIALDWEMRTELLKYKESLVQNIKVNLLKSFWRLAFMTYDTIKVGKGLGKSYSKLFTTQSPKTLVEGASYMNDAMSVVEGLTPKDADSELAKTIKDFTGNIGEIDKIYTDPKQIAVIAANKLKGKADEFIPKVNITDEEIEILRSQHLTREAIDDILLESHRENIIRGDMLIEIAEKINLLEAKQVKWELTEKDRVRQMLIDDYKRRTAAAGDCFIATAVYGSPRAGEIAILRAFRDEVLLSTWGGSKLVDFYYRFSPPIASYLTKHETARTVVREKLVEPIVEYVQSNYNNLPSSNNADLDTF